MLDSYPLPANCFEPPLGLVARLVLRLQSGAAGVVIAELLVVHPKARTQLEAAFIGEAGAMGLLADGGVVVTALGLGFGAADCRFWSWSFWSLR